MILVTGGTGFIGSHTCVQLIKAGYDVLVIDAPGSSIYNAFYDSSKTFTPSFSYSKKPYFLL